MVRPTVSLYTRYSDKIVRLLTRFDLRVQAAVYKSDGSDSGYRIRPAIAYCNGTATESDTVDQDSALEAEAENSTPTLSGYSQASGLESGDSVTEDLAEDDRNLGSVLRFPRAQKFFQTWFDWKRSLNEQYGLKLQMSYQALYQEADESFGEDTAAAGRGGDQW